MHSTIEQHFREFYRSWVKRVYSRVKNEQDAEDIVMEAYTRALKYQHTFSADRNYDFWFSRIIANAVKDWKREQHNQYGHAEEFKEEDYPVADPSIKRDLLTTIEEEIAKVEKEEQAEVLRLYFLQGYKHFEIVHITNTTSGSVKMLIHKFKMKMKGRHME